MRSSKGRKYLRENNGSMRKTTSGKNVRKKVIGKHIFCKKDVAPKKNYGKCSTPFWKLFLLGDTLWCKTCKVLSSFTVEGKKTSVVNTSTYSHNTNMMLEITNK